MHRGCGGHGNSTRVDRSSLENSTTTQFERWGNPMAPRYSPDVTRGHGDGVERLGCCRVLRLNQLGSGQASCARTHRRHQRPHRSSTPSGSSNRASVTPSRTRVDGRLHELAALRLRFLCLCCLKHLLACFLPNTGGGGHDAVHGPSSHLLHWLFWSRSALRLCAARKRSTAAAVMIRCHCALRTW